MAALGAVTDHETVAAILKMAGLATPMTLRVAVTLGLPDRLRGDGATVEKLAPELDVSPKSLELLLNHLVAVGVAERTPDGYRNTDLGAALCTDADNGLTNFLHLNMAGGRAEMAFVELLHSVTTGQAGYTHRFGQDFWADLSEQPHLRKSFDQQMTHRLRGQVPQIVAGYDWGQYASIVDVGGGNGTLLAAILAANPEVRGHLVELEATAAEANRTLGDRAQVTAGSFFDPLPPGADAYLLVDILHDWDDENAHRILRRCVEAAPPTSRILVIEPIGGRWDNTEYDLAMLAIFAGRERQIEEFRTLAAAHGLVLDNTIDVTPQRCLLEFRRAD